MNLPQQSTEGTRQYYSLYGRLLEKPRLRAAYQQVKRNRGAAGVDGQSLGDFEAKLDTEIDRLWQELKDKTYVPQAVKRVAIPKEGGGERLLGIPAVRDRVVQQALLNELEPIFDPGFHPSSYGYRPGRSCHQAISKASLFIRQYHRRWVVDMDLSKCFDTLDHDIIIECIRAKVADGSVLSLIKGFLESGVMIGEEVEATLIGSPQGGVISPLIANVYLDRFDQQMRRRGHRIVRYADDILILCVSEKAAQRALSSAKAYLEGELKLTVNATKTHIAHSDDGVKFLGVSIFTDRTQIQEKKLRALKAKVRSLTRRNTAVTLPEIIVQLNRVLRGFVNYFKIANCDRELKALMGWIRRRLRCIQLTHWKSPKKLQRRLRQLGYRQTVRGIKMKSWRSAHSPLANYAMPNRWFHRELKLVDMCAYTTGVAVPVV